MPNDVTITVSFDSSSGGTASLGGAADAAPSPLPLGVLGTSGAASGSSGQSGGQLLDQAPTPLPLDQLNAAGSQGDAMPPAPSLLRAPDSTGGGTAPTPLPLDELQSDDAGPTSPPSP
jgi:hypothetical protein